MKKFIAVVVTLGICGLYWFGCHKKATKPVLVEEEEIQVEKIAPPPPPPPAPAEGAEAAKPAEEKKAAE